MSGIVIIGAGQAGSSLAIKLRTLGYEGAVTLIGEEPYAPYQRPPLSKTYLLGEMALERLYLRPQELYRDHNIELRLAAQVTAIDPVAGVVSLGHETLAYDQLALTTGSTPRLLPEAIGGGLKNVFAVRGLADVDAMRPAFERGGHVLIIGGGYIGLEAAAVAAKRGLKVTLVEMAERILQRVACKETSDYFRDLHQSHGVTLLEGVGLSRLTGTDQVTGAILSNGETLDIDFALVGVGIQPNTGLAEAAGLTLNNGIETMRWVKPQRPEFGLPAIVRVSPTKAGAFAWKACPMPSIKPRWWRKICWALKKNIMPPRGFGPINMT